MEESGNKVLYHVTLTKNVPSIMEHGLRPTVGDRSKKLNEHPCVWLFPDQDSAADGVDQWFGDEVDDDDAIALLEIDLPPEIEVLKNDGIDWELYVTQTIPPHCITVMNENF